MSKGPQGEKILLEALEAIAACEHHVKGCLIYGGCSCHETLSGETLVAYNALPDEPEQGKRDAEWTESFAVGMIHELFRIIDARNSGNPAPQEFIENHRKLYNGWLDEIRKREALSKAGVEVKG